MTRVAVMFDRLAVGLAGLAFVAGGVGALWWALGPRAGGPLALGPLRSSTETAWWPWLCGAVGLVLIGLALRWIASHHRPPRARTVGIDSGLSAGVAPVADAAAAALSDRPGVASAVARATTEGGMPTITLTATVAARPGLATAVSGADDVALVLREMLGDTVAVRTRIRIDARRRRGLR